MDQDRYVAERHQTERVLFLSEEQLKEVKRAAKAGVYRELHDRGLLSDCQLGVLLDENRGELGDE